MTAPTIFDDIPIIDVDSHVAEPEDLWTSRLSRAKWGDRIPSVVWDPDADERRWKVGDMLLSAVGEYCTSGWDEDFPSHPPSLDAADPACWDASSRLQRMDSWGIDAQVLYPNVIGFDTRAFVDELGPDLAVACVRAYNDYLAEFAATDPKRLIPMMMLPVWDIDGCVSEMTRAKALGHRGVLFAALFERIGLPNISDPHWDRVLGAAQDLDLSINFHVGFSVRPAASSARGWNMRTKAALSQRTDRISFVARTSLDFAGIVEAACAVILRGVATKFPRLRFVSVESGFGYWPYVLEHMDWFWRSSGAVNEYPIHELPSDIWRRSFFATFWFEQESLGMLEEYADNVMFETDFPHESSIPALRENARALVSRNMAQRRVSQATARKVLFTNAARLYGLE